MTSLPRAGAARPRRNDPASVPKIIGSAQGDVGNLPDLPFEHAVVATLGKIEIPVNGSPSAAAGILEHQRLMHHETLP